MQHQRAYRSLVQAEPLTGKTHQIRLHCAFEGYPIVGDPLYGGEEESSLYLASIALRFHHPFRNQSMTLEVPLALKPRWLQDIGEANGPVAIRYRQAKVV